MWETNWSAIVMSAASERPIVIPLEPDLLSGGQRRRGLDDQAGVEVGGQVERPAPPSASVRSSEPWRAAAGTAWASGTSTGGGSGDAAAGLGGGGRRRPSRARAARARRRRARPRGAGAGAAVPGPLSWRLALRTMAHTNA